MAEGNQGIFITAPAQSAELQALNIASPQDIGMNVISPIFDAVAVENAVASAEDYYFDIKSRHKDHRTANNVNFEDLREAKRFKTGCKVAATIPALVNAFAHQNIYLAPIMVMLTDIQQNQALMRQEITLIQQNQTTIQQNQTLMRQEITAIQQVLTNIETKTAENHLATQQAIAFLNTKVSNATAHLDDDVVEPPQNGLVAPNPEFPKTILEIRILQPGLLLISIENYYGLIHTGSINTRIRRVKRAYGVTV